MKKLIIIVTINLLIPFFLFLLIPSILIRTRQGISSEVGEHLVSFVENKPIMFRFVSNLDNLQSLTLHLKNPSLNNISRISVDINSPSSSRSVVFSGSNVGDPISVPLKFLSFEEKFGTTYTVTMTTDNKIHNSLYVIADDQNNPLFKTYYRTTNFTNNLISNFYYQCNLFKIRSTIHNLAYISIVLLLDLLILFKREFQA